jgi:DNA-binding NarL/FixJ family response regulator
VALLVAQGLPNKGMARELALNVRTVETDRLRVFAKLALYGAVELATAVHDKDLVWKHCPRGR